MAEMLNQKDARGNGAMQIHDEEHEEEEQAQILRGGQNIEEEAYGEEEEAFGEEEEDEHQEDLQHLDSEMAK